MYFINGFIDVPPNVSDIMNFLDSDAVSINYRNGDTIPITVLLFKEWHYEELKDSLTSTINTPDLYDYIVKINCMCIGVFSRIYYREYTIFYKKRDLANGECS